MGWYHLPAHASSHLGSSPRSLQSFLGHRLLWQSVLPTVIPWSLCSVPVRALYTTHTTHPVEVTSLTTAVFKLRNQTCIHKHEEQKGLEVADWDLPCWICCSAVFTWFTFCFFFFLTLKSLVKLQKLGQLYFKKSNTWFVLQNWNEGPERWLSFCTSRGPGFDYQDPQGSSQLPVAPSTLFWPLQALGTHVGHRYTCRQNNQKHKIKWNLKQISKNKKKDLARQGPISLCQWSQKLLPSGRTPTSEVSTISPLTSCVHLSHFCDLREILILR